MATKQNVHAHLQNATAPWSSLLVIPRGITATTLVKPPAGFALRVVQGKKCKTPAGIFKEFARAFEFPDYCDCNWDSLEECLTELRDTPHGYVVLLDHCAEFVDHAPNELIAAMEIFEDVAEFWAEQGKAFWTLFGGIAKPVPGIRSLA